MEHSTPLSDGPFLGLRNTTISAHAAPAITSRSNERRHNGTQQSRRLQLRNAGFRGAVLPSRRISPIFGSPPPDTFNRPVNENSPLGLEKRTLYGEDMPPSPVNILQEIQNSTRRKRQVTRPGISNIFQDPTATEPEGETSGTSQQRHNDCSPVSFNTSPINMMKLREGSMNQKTPPPLSSPLAKHVKGRNLGRLNLRSTSFEASKYIEHLESQLTALNAKVDSLVSPNTNKARAAKLRGLTVEARSLRHELADWETNFAERVREGVDQRIGVESGLNTRLETMEDEGEVKDMRIKELEFEVETLRLKARDTKTLEITNINLEKRIDVLTSLLVQSPTKLEFGSATSSPCKLDPRKQTPRPISMIPRVPSSPGGVRLSLNTVNESSFWQGKGLRSNSSISETPEDTGSYDDEHSQTSSGPRRADQAENLDSPEIDTATSPSVRSVQSSSSRPTSLHSSSSLGATSWGLPLPAGGDVSAKSANRQRRMRRFPSGSCSLKPLILPNAAGTQSLPASAPAYAPRRETSGFSLDPTTAFLSHYDLSSPIATPTQQGRRASTTWAQEQALKTLEGRSGHPDEQLENVLHTPPVNMEENPAAALRATSFQERHKKPRQKSLEEELKKALMEAKGARFSGSFTVVPIEEADVVAAPSSCENSGASDSTLFGINNTSPAPSSSVSQPSHQHRHIEEDITPRPPKQPTMLDSPSKTSPSTALAKRSAVGLFGSLSEIIAQAKQEPTLLARRIVYNAWSLGSARLGGVGWWLLGLVLGPGVRKRLSKADDEIGKENNVGRRYDCKPYEANASRRRTAECFLRGEGKLDQLEPTRGNSGLHQTGPEAEPHVFPCDECVEPSSRRTLRLWFHFSLAIVLAVGIAIKHGPGALLIEPVPPPLLDEDQPLDMKQRGVIPDLSKKQSRQRSSLRTTTTPALREQRGERPILFAQVLQPKDFEGPMTPPASTHHWPS